MAILASWAACGPPWRHKPHANCGSLRLRASSGTPEMTIYFSDREIELLEWVYELYERRIVTLATAIPAAAIRQLLSQPRTAWRSEPRRGSMAINAEEVFNEDAKRSKPRTLARQSSCGIIKHPWRCSLSQDLFWLTNLTQNIVNNNIHRSLYFFLSHSSTLALLFLVFESYGSVSDRDELGFINRPNKWGGIEACVCIS